MQVKKYEAPTMSEALNLIKSELGPDAIILSTKKHRKGFGLLSKASVEITAAVSDRSLTKKKITERIVPAGTREQIGKMSASKQAEIYDEFHEHYQERVEKKRAKANSPAPQKDTRYADILDDEGLTPSSPSYARNGKISQPSQTPAQTPSVRTSTSNAGTTQVTQAAPAVTPKTSTGALQSLQEDVSQLKMLIQELKTEQVALSDVRIPEATTDELHEEFQNLLRNGIDKRYASVLMKQIAFSLPPQELHQSDRLVEALAVEIMNNIKIDNPFDFKPRTMGEQPRVFALVGPTGVGKTTTIAKLASQAILQKNLRVGLINLDTYKVAAVDQLATYAKILNVPFRQVTNAIELDRALTEFKPLDLILIDTSGISQKDSESLASVKSLLSECPAVRPLLILSATTRDFELYDVVNRFKIFNPTGLIFSKLDETSTFGCVYNVAAKTSLPLTYFTVGQRVPEDIELASTERVASLILDL